MCVGFSNCLKIPRVNGKSGGSKLAGSAASTGGIVAVVVNQDFALVDHDDSTGLNFGQIDLPSRRIHGDENEGGVCRCRPGGPVTSGSLESRRNAAVIQGGADSSSSAILACANRHSSRQGKRNGSHQARSAFVGNSAAAVHGPRSGGGLPAQGSEPLAAGADWPCVGGDRGCSRYSPLDQINRENVARLEVAWTYHTGELSRAEKKTIECTPLVVDGVLYLTTGHLRVVALDAATGTTKWEFDPFTFGEAAGPLASGGVNRGLAWWSDGQPDGRRRILHGTADGRLFSLDARTGIPDPGFGSGGYVNLREGLEGNLSAAPMARLRRRTCLNTS